MTLSAPVTGVDPTDFTLVKGNGVSANSALGVSGSGSTYTVTATGVSGAGTLGLQLVDDGTIHDVNGNPLQGTPPPVFATKTDFATGTRPYSVAVADVNGDGKPDLVIANFISSTVSVLLGTGSSGSAAFAAKTDFATGGYPVSVAVADVNGDGQPDLVLANFISSTVSVLLGTGSSGSAAFAAKTDFATGSSPISVAVADVNGDGQPDLVLANINSNTVSVLLGTGSSGNAAFAARTDFATGSKPVSVAVADVNEDGQPDLVLANFGSSTVSVLLGTGSSGSAAFAAQTDFATGSNPYSVAVADVNGDGQPDLVVANKGSNTVSVLLGTGSSGSAAFAAKTDFATGTNPRSVAVADVNGDGQPDLVLANASSNTVSVLLGTGSSGSAAFAAKADFATGSLPDSVAVADVNGDGQPDLVAANQGGNMVSVLPGAGVGSFTGDTVTIQPPVVSLAVSPGSVVESSTTGLAYTFTRTANDFSQPLTVHFTKTGTATFTSDYTASASGTLDFAAGTLVIPANSATATLTLVPVDDAVVEGNETAVLTVATDAAYTISGGSAAGAIVDNDTATLTLSGGTAHAEGQSGATAFTFTATLDHAVQGGFSVAYATSDGTATIADADYAENHGQLTFAGAAGETKTITVLVTGDTKFENDEAFTVALGAVSGAPGPVSADPSPQTATIINDDTAPAISIADTSVLEGDAGAPHATFTVSLSNASILPVTVDFATANGTAIAPGDYTALSHGTITFSPGETSHLIDVAIRPDTLYESGADETFLLKLSHPGNATLGQAQAVGTILSDDGAPASAIALDAKHPFTFFDHNHDKVTVKLSGLAVGTLTLDGGVLTGADISEIHVGGNASKSTLSIAVTKDKTTGDGLVRLGEVTVDGALASFSGKAADFTVGGLRAAGPVKAITAHALLAGEIVTGTGAEKLALSVGTLGAGDPFLIATPQIISSLKTASIGVGEIEAAALGSITASAGSLAANITSVGAIGKIKVVSGDLSGALVASSFGAVTISSGVFRGSLTSSNPAVALGKTKALASLSVTGGDLSGEVHLAGASGGIAVKRGDLRGDLEAASFGAVSVTTGNFSGTLNALASAAALAKTAAVKSLTVSGGNFTGEVTALGAVGAVTIKSGAFRGQLSAASLGAVSVINGDFSGILTALTPAATLGKVAALKSLSIRNGDLTGDVRVLGGAGAVSIKGAKNGPGGNVSGSSFVAGSIASLTVSASVAASSFLAGADLGTDHALGGGDDSFAAGSIGAVLISGSVSGASVIAAGLSSTNAIFKDGDDTVLGGAASSIKSFTIGGTAAADSYFVAGSFKAVPKIAGVKVALPDPRFKVA